VSEHPRTAVLLLAAGSGTRVGAGTNKVLLGLGGAPMLVRSLRTVLSLPYVERLVVVARRDDVGVVSEVVEQVLPEDRTAELVVGGETRHDSEWRGLAPLRETIASGGLDVVVVHDVARPLADPALFDATVDVARQHGGAVPVRPQPGLVTAAGDAHVRGLVAVQTPQAFRAAELLDAYTRAEADGFTGTDTASCFSAYSHLPVHAVPAPATNLKVTFPEDVLLAERLLPSG
jgi:2-C-methyl-D-erythritol 4-phosphate cytidylyltransferase